ncbi:hypothetical protein GUITHDRAFT_144358 [Guillardia theta CCMP2712]|uniref:Armadillo repeat-containing domain-containing protein n=1 Tax=Guillardia theta (strain CCMP2712) TaxID=905079 RepID=L1IPQ6_GUITC|nr:hypothetical protein GUITHDRAFT_144358 [Guillardia theta CCMP2712]EKX38243.1 hypothetical protein GUITHDRAFT_144358 [Guillardia theta CCMP2712]|eukprot:XP_005825223.1 hypothetical protein GUITHDRAFT_144358 [Guillardia theta CCMP2712]
MRAARPEAKQRIGDRLEVESAVYLLKIQDSDTSDWSRRNLIGGRAKIIRRLIDLLDGNPWESKNAALCLGNLCCDCPINQVIIGTTTIGTRTIFSGLVRLVLHSKDETTKIFACLAINNLACNIENAHNICLFPFAIPGAIKSKYMIVSEFSAGT